MCCPLVFEFSVGIEGFVIGLGQISFFFSSYKTLLLYIFLVIKSHLNYAVFLLFSVDPDKNSGGRLPWQPH